MPRLSGLARWALFEGAKMTTTTTTPIRYADPVAQDEIDRLRAGEDRSRPIDPAAWPTPGQLWAQLIDADTETRLLMLEAAIEARGAFNRCYIRRHDAQIEELEAQAPKCVGCAHFGEPQEECPAHGRAYAEWVQIASDQIAIAADYHERLERIAGIASPPLDPHPEPEEITPEPFTARPDGEPPF